MNVLQVKNIYKSFGKAKVLKDISFNVEEGEIVGFVGPNGAGKTTTLKIITDLIRPDKGEVIICGKNLKTNRNEAISNISGIIEMPGLYQFSSGMENLKFVKNIRKIDDETFEKVVKSTGLDHHLSKKVSQYSLGMKQRLAIGMSILSKPKLLILDEPTNGLDPTGIIELRKTLVNLAKTENTSVLFSSHNLTEVEKIADRVIYIKNGSLIDSSDEITPKLNQYLLETSNTEMAVSVLSNAFNSLSVASNKEFVIINLVDNQVTIGEIVAKLVQNDIKVLNIIKNDNGMEDLYSSIFL